jgi:hypothetical protein
MVNRISLMGVLAMSVIAACCQTAQAQPGWGRHHGYHGYYGYARPVIVPPPVVVAPGYAYGVAAYPPPAPYVATVAPVPVVPPPPMVVPPPPPVYVPSYTYGAIGPRGGFGFGYSSPGFGVYVGR